MEKQFNAFNQAIGVDVDNWAGAKPPERKTLHGQYCRLEPLDVDRHAGELYQAFTIDQDASLWTYLPFGPFGSFDSGDSPIAGEQQFLELIAGMSSSVDPLFFAIIDASTEKAQGIAAYLRIKPINGAIEIGSIVFSKHLQKTVVATEAMFLFMQHAFEELGYRRYEWKCDSLNAPSRKAAERLGFSYEGLFRQALVYKGRNRDTAWYSIKNKEWPAIARGFVNWLDDINFDDQGRQRRSLQSCIMEEQA